MKFSKPINREIDIEGITFIVSFDDNGIDFRVKGKRRTAHADWTQVLNIAGGEQSASGREFLGVGAGQPERQETNEAERMEQIFDPRAAETNRAEETQSANTTRDELGRAAGAGETGPES